MSCGYQGHEFGAAYPDSICIDGTLWDADSGDSEGLTHCGDIPCPSCDPKGWMAYHRPEFIDRGFGLAYDELQPRDIRYRRIPEEIKAHPGLLTKIKRQVRRGWYVGRKVFIQEQKEHGE